MPRPLIGIVASVTAEEGGGTWDCAVDQVITSMCWLKNLIS